jgi:hypothetical protein
LIFPESAGSLAEVGFFSNSDVREKTLVINDYRYQTTDSFANLGPIRTIDDHSFLRPAVHLNRSGGLFDFGPVQERLTRLFQHPRRKTVDYNSFTSLNYREKLVIVLETIRVLRTVTASALHVAVKTAFQSCRSRDLRQLLSILVSAGYVSHQGPYFLAQYQKPSLAEFEGFSSEDLTVRAVYYYQRHRPTVYAILDSIVE